jgi:hypothetical protein
LINQQIFQLNNNLQHFGQGNSLIQLSCPTGVIVDQWGQIYVADYDNHRVMRWCDGAKEGTIVVGGNGEGNLYVTGRYNHRIQKFEID